MRRILPLIGSTFLAAGSAALGAGCAGWSWNAEDPPRPGEFSFGNDFARVCWSPVEVDAGGTMVLRSLRVNERNGADLRGVEVFGWVDSDADGVVDPGEERNRFETHPSARDTFVEFGEIRIVQASSARMMVRVDHSDGEPLELVLK